MLLHQVAIIALIAGVDLALSGDNALIIASVASRLPEQTRAHAIIAGGGVAIALRISFTAGATFILTIPLLKAISGLTVFFIAFQVIRDVDPTRQELHMPKWRQHLAGKTFLSAILAIAFADLSMSLDNILAIAALANGAIILLLLGLVISILLLLVASAFLSKIFERFPLLLYVAGIVLTWTAGTMIYTDSTIHPYLDRLDKHVLGLSFPILFPVALSLVTVPVILLTERHRWRDAGRD